MNEEELYKLIEQDQHNLLVPEKKPQKVTSSDRLVDSFLEISNFYIEHGREPRKGTDITERKLAARLAGFRDNPEHVEVLKQYDEHGLLTIYASQPETITDIFEDDSLGILDIEESSILNIKNVPVDTRTTPEFIAKRKPCKDFLKYEHLFNGIQTGLLNGTWVFGEIDKHTELQPGTFFILSGIVGYIQESEEMEKDEKKRIDARLRVIFENGTESNMFLQSLRRSIQKENGKIIRPIKPMEIENEDTQTGHIYVLKSKSKVPRISSIKDLYKIGFTTNLVEDRIKGAELDPTYLMAPIKVALDYTCFNINPHRFERLIHRLFGEAKLDIEMFDSNGVSYTPKEWFVVPLDVIEQAIELIINGEIINYSYDHRNKIMIKKR
ncbi:MAG: hypothetical protein COV59_03850 [Candidatus Magasanikbacteria bacterium CG11_big_fil_rev_8_21_14_0_20_39_34]|uniref:Bacteriophage T5 Orf172 DNA-binding domain-containing protein n=1 Tax=Candidatus Magasanikbacteria bacterium CG11_big_fil_rev_8_21_14_0_20_39_34 TaxID=1974653 RepID=A0A2H0N4E9_9BACT|nr:MAG: hypothetical protein COV59_03850 [Candidatus Magasanikbacteria bacterium CG11_big_fil_rev_8_21_14_0_20_39_34]